MAATFKYRPITAEPGRAIVLAGASVIFVLSAYERGLHPRIVVPLFILAASIVLVIRRNYSVEVSGSAVIKRTIVGSREVVVDETTKIEWRNVLGSALILDLRPAKGSGQRGMRLPVSALQDGDRMVEMLRTLVPPENWKSEPQTSGRHFRQ